MFAFSDRMQSESLSRGVQYLASRAFRLFASVDALDAQCLDAPVEALDFASLGLQLLQRDLVRAAERAVLLRVLRPTTI